MSETNKTKAHNNKEFYTSLIWSAGIGLVVGLVTAIVMRIPVVWIQISSTNNDCLFPHH